MRLERTAFFVALQEALISLAPYIVLASMALLLGQFALQYDLRPGGVEPEFLVAVSDVLARFAAVGVVVAVAYHFSMRYDTDRILSILLSLAVYATIEGIDWAGAEEGIRLPRGIDFLQIAVPIATVFLFRAIAPYTSLNIPLASGHLFVARVFRHIYAFALTWLAMVGLYVAGSHLALLAGGWLQQASLELPSSWLLAIRALLAQTFWFFGIHGPRMANAVLDPAFLDEPVFPGLTYGEFYRLFAVSGGSGMGLSLLLALFLVRPVNRHALTIARISVPFVVFNINTLLIYGLPVVLNRFLLLPFLLLPQLNLAVAAAVLSAVPVDFAGADLVWTTPPLVDGYLASGGNPVVLLLQAALIAGGVLVYLPFLRRYAACQDLEQQRHALAANLGLVSSLKSKEGLESVRAQHSIIESNYRLGRVIRALNRERLMVHYQPKVDLEQGGCHSWEALLRLQLSDGTVTGPFFLEEIENAGIASVVDLWVCEQVKSDLERWERSGFRPRISINLHPDTLVDLPMIRRLASLLEGRAVEFEIVERALVEDRARESLALLKERGFEIAIDDFGEGYFSYRLIRNCRIDTIKIDRSLVEMVEDERGRIICRHVLELCRALRYRCVVEGVETGRQLEFLARMGVRYVQGFYFARAMPAEAVPGYRPPPPERGPERPPAAAGAS